MCSYLYYCTPYHWNTSLTIILPTTISTILKEYFIKYFIKEMNCNNVICYKLWILRDGEFTEKLTSQHFFFYQPETFRCNIGSKIRFYFTLEYNISSSSINGDFLSRSEKMGHGPNILHYLCDRSASKDVVAL